MRKNLDDLDFEKIDLTKYEDKILTIQEEFNKLMSSKKFRRKFDKFKRNFMLQTLKISYNTQISNQNFKSLSKNKNVICSEKNKYVIFSSEQKNIYG